MALSKNDQRKLIERTALNFRYVQQNSGKDIGKLKVQLKKDPMKGASLYARKNIKEGELIAYYKIMVFDMNTYDSPTEQMYQFDVYTKTGRISSRLIGDLYPGSAAKARGSIPFWAYFSNEPSSNQEENAYVDDDVKGNYRNRTRLNPGDTMIYKLYASRDIPVGAEITWCYGGSYVRDYSPNCPE